MVSHEINKEQEELMDLAERVGFLGQGSQIKPRKTKKNMSDLSIGKQGRSPVGRLNF